MDAVNFASLLLYSVFPQATYPRYQYCSAYPQPVVVEIYKIHVNAHGAGKESRTPNALALGPKPSPYANSGIPANN